MAVLFLLFAKDQQCFHRLGYEYCGAAYRQRLHRTVCVVLSTRQSICKNLKAAERVEMARQQVE